MRIISGKYKSRILDFPKNKLTRPMTDRTKESLFNMIHSLIADQHILDLFSGSGSIGLECLSRGAASVTFVDQADWAIKTIRNNIRSLAMTESHQILQIDVDMAIKTFEKDKRSFSIIFIDPPFNKGLVKKTLMRLDRSDILLPFAQVIVGRSNREDLPEKELKNLRLIREKKIGQAYLSFLLRVENTDEETQSDLSRKF